MKIIWKEVLLLQNIRDKINYIVVFALDETFSRTKYSIFLWIQTLIQWARCNENQIRTVVISHKYFMYMYWEWTLTSQWHTMNKDLKVTICGVFKQNEFEDIEFLIQPIIVFNFVCILLFWARLNCPYKFNLEIFLDSYKYLHCDILWKWSWEHFYKNWCENSSTGN